MAWHLLSPEYLRNALPFADLPGDVFESAQQNLATTSLAAPKPSGYATRLLPGMQTSYLFL